MTVRKLPWLNERQLFFWAAFVLVQMIVVWVGSLQTVAIGDVPYAYGYWLQQIHGGDVVGIDKPWVYPPLALLVILGPTVFAGIASEYLFQWAIMVTIVNAVAFGILLGRAHSISRNVAAGFWLAAMLSLGAVGQYRLDGVTAALGVIAVVLLSSHPRIAAVIATVGVWIKIWPAAILLGAWVAMRKRMRLVLPAVVVSLVVVLSVIALGGAGNIFGFLLTQTGRGLQVEAPLALAHVWGRMLGVDGVSIAYDNEIWTNQVHGPGVTEIAWLTTPLLILGTTFIALLGWRALRSGVSSRALIPPLVFALTLMLIVMNKVGSPQFQSWLIAPTVLWLLWERRTAFRYAVMVIVSSVLTQLVFPILYAQVLSTDLLGVLVLTARNVLLIVMLAGTIRHLVSLRSRQPGHFSAQELVRAK